SDTGEKGSQELYGLAPGLHAGVKVFTSGKTAEEYAKSVSVEEKVEFLSTLPFDSLCRVEWSDRSKLGAVGERYFAEDAKWRRVDEDWLHVAPDLALQLDNVTNNTSLAIAIERIADGKVLLFPADAQQGNWLSWQGDAVKWTVKDGEKERVVKAKDLLARTVFYKVGHHASHNATAK